MIKTYTQFDQEALNKHLGGKIINKVVISKIGKTGHHRRIEFILDDISIVINEHLIPNVIIMKDE